MRIAIAGAGAVGRSVAQELVDYGHKVLLIEKEVARYEPSTVPVPSGCWPTRARCPRWRRPRCTSATSPSPPPATTRPTSRWPCWPRPSSGSTRVVARINDSRNEWLFTEAWGVDVAVSTPIALVAAVEGAIDVGHVVRLMDLGRGARAGVGTGTANVAKFTCPTTARWWASGCATSRCRTTARWSR